MKHGRDRAKVGDRDRLSGGGDSQPFTKGVLEAAIHQCRLHVAREHGARREQRHLPFVRGLEGGPGGLLRRRRRALVRYKSLSSGRTTERRIDPYHVFNLRGNWYVAAWDERRKAVRDFAIHRIRRITVMTNAYDIPRGFDFKKYMGERSGSRRAAARPRS